MNIKTHLISGAGNTFHVSFSDDWQSLAPRMHEITKGICQKVPADGMIFLQKYKDKTDGQENYSWHFYNNDGSVAEMCGNATRCVGHYIKYILKSPLSDWSLTTTAGPIRIQQIGAEKFKITMTPIKNLRSQEGFFCDTGVPHLVIEKKEFQINNDLRNFACELRWRPEFSPKGTNVTIVVSGADLSKLRAVSYERGVENFTAACGTGAMAAAYYNLTKRAVKQTQVEMPGGTLMMDLSDTNAPTMTGPAILLGSHEHEISN